MKDPIERQDIIKELESWLKVEGYSEGELNIIKAVLYELQSLPSAQQDVTDTNVGDMINRQAAISRAVTITMFGRDIRVVGVSELESLPSAQPDLDEWCTDCKEYDKEKHSCPRFNRVIREALKDAEQRKTGKWIKEGGVHYCSECGVGFFEYVQTGEAIYFVEGYNRTNHERRSVTPGWCEWLMNFCPSCGADMREKYERLD